MADDVVRDIPEEMVERAARAAFDALKTGVFESWSFDELGVHRHHQERWRTTARAILSAALAGRQVVDLPEPDHVETDEANPGKGSARWRTSDLRPARAAVIVSRGVADQPILMIDGLIWETAEARKVAEMFLAAARYAERLAARAAAGSGSGED